MVFRHTVARVIEQLGLKAVILEEQPNQGRTVIEKFEEEAAEVGFRRGPIDTR